MRNIDRLEQLWHNLVLIFPSAKDVSGAVVACNPEIPMNLFNHAADISVNEDEADKLLNKVAKYFVSKASPHVCFRVSPLTHPSSFSSFLEDHGFMKEG